MLTDHKVAYLNANQVKSHAIAARSSLIGNTLGWGAPANALLQLSRAPIAKGQCLKIEFRSASILGSAAVVSYKPLKIEVDRIVWNKALLAADADSSFVLAHELGHVLLHDYDAQPFSGQKKDWIPSDEESAEWQANRFADCYLVRDEDIQEFVSPDIVSLKCRVSLAVAERRFRDVAKLAASRPCGRIFER